MLVWQSSIIVTIVLRLGLGIPREHHARGTCHLNPFGDIKNVFHKQPMGLVWSWSAGKTKLSDVPFTLFNRPKSFENHKGALEISILERKVDSSF